MTDDNTPPVSDDSGQDIVEDATPVSGLREYVQLPQPKDFHERMQGRLIYLFAALLILTLVAGAIGWLLGDVDLRDWISFTAPIFTLSGSALAYYFGQGRRKK